MVVYEKENGQCELRGSIKHDELGGMGHFVPMKKRFIKSTIAYRLHILKITYFNTVIKNL